MEIRTHPNASLSLYAKLAGRSGSQSLAGGTGSGEDLTLLSTTHGTPGHIYLGTGSGFAWVSGVYRWYFGGGFYASPAFLRMIFYYFQKK